MNGKNNPKVTIVKSKPPNKFYPQFYDSNTYFKPYFHNL
jgi:hypothetical protein